METSRLKARLEAALRADLVELHMLAARLGMVNSHAGLAALLAECIEMPPSWVGIDADRD